jgi:hypothetical protein
MTDLLGQIGDIVGGDLASDLGLARQIGVFFTRDGYAIGGVSIDTILNESHDTSMNITTQPVEMGADITDHIYANPATVNVSGIISDVTNNTFFDIGLIGFGGDVLEKITGKPQQSKSQQSWAKLEQIARKGQLIDLVTNLKTYTNMAIVGMSCTQDKDSVLEVRFSMSLREVFIVSSATFAGDIGTLLVSKPTTSVAKNNKPTADKAATVVEKGEVQGKEPDKGSFLFRAATGVRNLFGGG